MNSHLESRQEPIPGYRLIERLGRGGYGDVWKVEAPGGFYKAIKFVFGQLGDEVEATADQELEALRRLVQIRHPFILSVERCDVVDNQVLITMELADRSLEDRFNECLADNLSGVPRDELLRYMTEAAEALDLLAQEYRLQHLDIKPTNLFLVRRHVKVGDFGLVRQLDDFEAPIKCGLTPLYAPPESYEGKISLNSDQYSLALVYHEMLTGVRAIDGESGRELMFRTLVDGPNLSAVDEPERSVLAKALAKKPRERYSSCQEFVAALQSSSVFAPTMPEIVFDDEAARAGLDERSKRIPGRIADENAKRGRPSSHHSIKRPPTRRHKRFGVADLKSAERPAVSTDGTLQPTLVIGVGGFGVRMAERVRGVLQTRFGEAASKLPVHVLHVDVDADALRHAAELDGVVEGGPQPFICRLRKGADYRTNWDSSKHISSWLEQEQVFRIGQSGETRGQRSLGRLALVENFERVGQHILGALGSLLSVETAEFALQTTGLRYRSVEPRVFIAAGMGGGTGGGMALDLAYLVTAILRNAGFREPDVRLAMTSGIHVARDHDLQSANQFAVANDLASFWGGECEYALPVPFGDLPDAVKGPPAKAALFLDVQAEHLAEPRDRAALEAFAEFVVESSTGGHDALTARLPSADEPFIGIGWFSLVHPHDLVLRAAGCEFALRVVDRWLQPLNDAEREERQRFAREYFEKRGYEPAKVGELLQSEAAARNGAPLHAQAAVRVNRLIESLAQKGGKKVAQTLVSEARNDLRLLLGGDPVDDETVYEAPSTFEAAYREAMEAVAERLYEPIKKELESAVDLKDRRFEVVRGGWAGFSDALTGLVKRLVDSQKTRDLERIAYDAAYDLHKALVLGALPREYVAAVERWVKAKLDYNGRLKLVALYQLEVGKIDALAVQVFTAPRKLESSKQRLVDLREEALVAATSLVRQAVYPGGAVTTAESLDLLQQKLESADLDDLESVLRTDLFDPEGGVWETCARPDIPPENIADAMAGVTATWLMLKAPMREAADVFLERHQGNDENRRQELGVFQEWCAPSFAPKADGAKRVSESLTVLVPATPSGQQLAVALAEAYPDRELKFAAHMGSDVHFVQTASSASLGRLAPAWLLKGKALYDSPNFRASAVVFPQAANV